MTDTSQTPQTGIAQAVGELSEETRKLVRQEIGTAQQEMRSKALQSAPALTLAATAGACGLLAAASAYRASLRLLERRMSPATAALAALLGYGTAAAVTAVLAARQIRRLPPLFPAETVRQTSEAVAGVTDNTGTAGQGGGA